MSSAEALHVSDDRLIDLECDLLDPAARAATVDHLRGCADCERRFAEVRRDAERLAVRQARFDSLHGVSKPGPPSGLAARLPARVPSRTRALWASAAAVLLIGLLAVLVVSRRSIPRGDGLDLWLPVDAERLLLRAAPSPEDGGRYAEAVEAYAQHDARRVIELLDGRAMPAPYAPLDLLLASAFIWEGRLDDARAALKRLDIETLPEPARGRALFLLYTVLRRQGRTAEAHEVLRRLASEGGEFSDRARQELERR